MVEAPASFQQTPPNSAPSEVNRYIAARTSSDGQFRLTVNLCAAERFSSDAGEDLDFARVGLRT